MSQPFAYETKQDNKYRLSLSEFNKPAKYRSSVTFTEEILNGKLYFLCGGAAHWISLK